MLRDLVHERGRHYRADDDAAVRQIPAGVARAEDVVGEEHAHFVAREQHVLAFVKDGYAHGVGGEHEIRARLFRLLDGELERLGLFGVGIRAGRERAARHPLLLHDRNVAETALIQRRRHEAVARAVKRSIDYLDGICGVEALLFHEREELLVDVLTDVGDQAVVHVIGKGAGLDLEGIHLLNVPDDVVRFVVQHLAARGVEQLVAVVLLGIVAGSDHDAHVAAQLTHRERQEGRGRKLGYYVHLDPVGREHFRGRLCEFLGLDAAVVADDRRFHPLCFHGAGYAFRDLSDVVYVEAIGTDAEDAPHAARTELEVFVESVLDRRGIVRHFVQLAKKRLVGHFRFPLFIPFDSCH